MGTTFPRKAFLSCGLVMNVINSEIADANYFHLDFDLKEYQEIVSLDVAGNLIVDDFDENYFGKWATDTTDSTLKLDDDEVE